MCYCHRLSELENSAIDLVAEQDTFKQAVLKVRCIATSQLY